jgi:Delta3-Delta2-enoyl-CoA isomerase
MQFIELSKDKQISTVKIKRGKVNAINEPFVEELYQCFKELEDDFDTRAVILTGQGKFFSFGLDIPELISYSPKDFARFLTKFTGLYTYIFAYPKPVVMALNGHTIAGGCMLAIAGDYRVMTSGKASISLNELSFGSSVFAGSVIMLKYLVGARYAEQILLVAGMYSAEQAKSMGLVDEVADESEFMQAAIAKAQEYISKYPPAFASIKGHLRKSIVAEMIQVETKSIEDFIEIWYSKNTQKNIREIKIRE